jgi:hypothetical protein
VPIGTALDILVQLMPAPPPKPKAPANDFEEVERALSVLKGQHPEAEKLRRKDAEALEKKQKETQKVYRAEMLKRGAKVAGVLVVLGFVALGISRMRASSAHEASRASHVDQALAPFKLAGFSIVATSTADAPDSLEASGEAGCFLAVAVGANRSVKVTRASHPSPVVDGGSPLLFCTCEADHFTVKGDVGADSGVALMRIDGPQLGGSRAQPFFKFKPTTVARTDEACREPTFDAWLAAKHWTPPPTNELWLDGAPWRKTFVEAGMSLIATAPGKVPLVVFELGKESCMLLASNDGGDELGLRLTGGATVPKSRGPIAWCGRVDGEVVLEHDGDGEVGILAGPAARVGGMLGLREIARDANLTLGLAFVAPQDRGWNAKETLVASGIADSGVTPALGPDIPKDLDSRIVALSSVKPNAMIADVPEDVFSYCSPSLQTEDAICAFSGLQLWKPTAPDVVVGVGRATRPPWLSVMSGVGDPAAMKAMTQLLTLARRLRRDGFEPTNEFVNELGSGVEVTGRRGDDKIVAVGVGSVDPWVAPYTEAYPGWSLEGPAHFVPLKEGQKVTLLAYGGRGDVAKSKRKTVVFRRRADDDKKN